MGNKKLIKVINNKKRLYNGIGYQQVAEVSEDNLQGYLSSGFSLYKVKKAKATAPKADDGKGGKADPVKLEDADREARVEFLKTSGVNAQANWKDKTILTKSDELGYEAGDEFDPAEDEEEEGEE
jgi:hypothetical protein